MLLPQLDGKTFIGCLWKIHNRQEKIPHTPNQIDPGYAGWRETPRASLPNEFLFEPGEVNNLVACCCNNATKLNLGLHDIDKQYDGNQ